MWTHLETQKNAEVPGWAIIDGVDKVAVGPRVQALFQTVSTGFSDDDLLRVIAAIWNLRVVEITPAYSRKLSIKVNREIKGQWQLNPSKKQDMETKAQFENQALFYK